jgi:hypothetical protein
MKFLCVSLTALVLALGCAGPEVQVDYDAKAAFPVLHTYDWYAAAPASQVLAGGVKNPFMDARVHRAVEAVMASKHFQKETAADPDFLVTYYPVYQPRLRHGHVNVGLGFQSPGLGVGFAGPVAGPPLGQAGSIVLEITDNKTHQMIWRAEAEDVLDPHATPSDSDQDVAEAVTKMLRQFPPTPSPS